MVEQSERRTSVFMVLIYSTYLFSENMELQASTSHGERLPRACIVVPNIPRISEAALTFPVLTRSS